MSSVTTIECTGDQRRDMVQQITGPVIASICGLPNRIRPIRDGIEMPVSNGYRVRVRLAADDTYIVERVFIRNGKEFPKGTRVGVYCDQVSDAAYYASCFRSHSETEWVTA